MWESLVQFGYPSGSLRVYLLNVKPTKGIGIMGYKNKTSDPGNISVDMCRRHRGCQFYDVTAGCFPLRPTTTSAPLVPDGHHPHPYVDSPIIVPSV